MSESPCGLGAVILCGGQSRRMGRDKAWLPFGGDATLLGRTVRLFRQGVSPSKVAVVAAPGQDLPELEGDVEVVRDRRPGEGPLEGIASGLEALNQTGGWIVVGSCDLPLLKPDLLERLVVIARQMEQNIDCDGVVPRVDGLWQPLTAVYRARLLPRIRSLLQQGKRRMTDLLEVIAVREVGEEEISDVDPNLVSFRHCNTPDEYAALLRHADA
jgi:molybdopterin-guanine dinucleotide biosynthesis protein A